MHRKAPKSAYFIGIALFLIIVGGIYFSLPRLVANSLEESLGVPVTVGKVRPTLSSISLYDINIENPKGSKLQYAFRVRDVHLIAPITEYFRPNANIKQIVLNNIYMSVEFYSADKKKSNWTELLNAVNDPEEEAPKGERPGDKRTLFIHQLQLNQVQVELLFSGVKPDMLKPIKHIVINDINPESGKLSKRITRILTNHILKSVSMAAGIKGVMGVIISAPVTVVKTIFAPFKFLFGNKDKAKTKEPDSEKASSKNQAHAD